MTIVIDPVQQPDSNIELAACHLRKEIRGVSILQDLTLQILKGENLGIIGPSGSGKSTLLRCLALLDDFSSGEIFFKGQRIASGHSIEIDENKYRQKVGIVFQEFNLWHNRTLLQNICEAPIHVLGMSTAKARQTALSWLDRVGLQGHEEKYPSELSGGQRQRGALARAFAMSPEVLLLDEITSALDIDTTARLLDLIRDLRTPDTTFIFVTHHLTFAEQYMNRIAVLVDGRVVEQGQPSEVLHSPRAAETRNFLRVVKEAW